MSKDPMVALDEAREALLAKARQIVRALQGQDSAELNRAYTELVTAIHDLESADDECTKIALESSRQARATLRDWKRKNGYKIEDDN